MEDTIHGKKMILFIGNNVTNARLFFEAEDNEFYDPRQKKLLRDQSLHLTLLDQLQSFPITLLKILFHFLLK